MKNILLISCLLFSGLVKADTTSQLEAMRVANVLIGNPEAVAEMNKVNVEIYDYTIVSKARMINEFTFYLGKYHCECTPRPGILKITQDRLATEVDGPIKYKSDLTWQ